MTLKRYIGIEKNKITMYLCEREAMIEAEAHNILSNNMDSGHAKHIKNLADK